MGSGPRAGRRTQPICRYRTRPDAHFQVCSGGPGWASIGRLAGSSTPVWWQLLSGRTAVRWWRGRELQMYRLPNRRSSQFDLQILRQLRLHDKARKARQWLRRRLRHGNKWHLFARDAHVACLRTGTSVSYACCDSADGIVHVPLNRKLRELAPLPPPTL